MPLLAAHEIELQSFIDVYNKFNTNNIKTVLETVHLCNCLDYRKCPFRLSFGCSVYMAETAETKGAASASTADTVGRNEMGISEDYCPSFQ